MAKKINLMTFNARVAEACDPGTESWASRKDFFVETINKAELDFLGVQEAQNNVGDNCRDHNAPYEKSQLGYIEQNVKKSNLALLRKEDGELYPATIFYNEKVWDINERFPQIDLGDDRYAVCAYFKLKEEAQIGVYFCNTHATTDRQETKTFEIIRHKLFNEIIIDHPTDPVYFLGDFNGHCGPDGKSGCKIYNGLVAVFASKPEMYNFDRDFKQGDVSGTGHGVKQGNHFKHNVYVGDHHEKGYTRLIDHIFVPNNLGEGNYNPVIGIYTRTKDGQTQYPTDHFPISVTVDYTKIDYCTKNPSKPVLIESPKYKDGAVSFKWEVDQKDKECPVMKYLVYNYKGVHYDNLITTLDNTQATFTEEVSGSSKYDYYVAAYFADSRTSESLKVTVKEEMVKREELNDEKINNQGAKSNSADLSLNIMTFNVRISPAGGDDRQKEWNERKDFVLSILKGEENTDSGEKIGVMDFIGIQEAGGFQMDYIMSNMSGLNYKQVPGNGALLLYKADSWNLKNNYSFEVTGDQWGPRYVKCGLFSEIVESSKNVFVCNTHLHVGRDEIASYPKIDENLQKIRQDNPDSPVILMGDFNANCRSDCRHEEIQGMGCKVGNGLVDIFAPKPEENNFNPNDNRATFHNWSGGPDGNYNRIDHIFIPDYAFFSDPEKNKAINNTCFKTMV